MRPATLREVATRVSVGEPLPKAVAEFLDRFYDCRTMSQAYAMVAEEPKMTGQAVADAMLAAIADYLIIQYTDRAPPGWARKPERVLEEPYFADPAPGLREWLCHQSPAEFITHNIFCESQPLRRKKTPGFSLVEDAEADKSVQIGETSIPSR